MDEVNWLVQDGPFEEDLGPIIEEIKRQGHPLKIIKYEPFESGSYKHLYPEDACVIFYGSINLAMQLQRETPWIPGPMVNMDNYYTTMQVAHWRDHLLNKNGMFLPFNELVKRVQEGNTNALPYSSSANYFIRPNGGGKLFTGQVIDMRDSKSDLAYLSSEYGRCKPDDLIYVSNALNMHFEYRLIVVDGKIIAGSKYKQFGELEATMDSWVPQDVLDEAQSILDKTKWRPERAFIMDVHQSVGLKVKVIELNAVSCSGWYAADPEPIVRELSRVALEEWREIYEIL